MVRWHTWQVIREHILKLIHYWVLLVDAVIKLVHCSYRLLLHYNIDTDPIPIRCGHNNYLLLTLNYCSILLHPIHT